MPRPAARLARFLAAFASTVLLAPGAAEALGITTFRSARRRR